MEEEEEEEEEERREGEGGGESDKVDPVMLKYMELVQKQREEV